MTPYCLKKKDSGISETIIIVLNKVCINGVFENLKVGKTALIVKLLGR